MKFNIYTRLLLALLCITFLCSKSGAQKVFVSVQGDHIVGTLPTSAGGDEYFFDGKCLYRKANLTGTILDYAAEATVITCPEYEISGMTICVINGHAVVTLLIRAGGTVVYDDAGLGSVTVNPPVPSVGGSQPPLQITGDALYVRSYNYVSKSVDHGLTWGIDTLGLNGAFLYSICTDTFQKVYLAANTGLFTQTANGTAWVRDSGFPAGFCGLVYTDRRSRVFALGSSNILYTSNDTGISFHPDTAGLGEQQVSSIGDDVYGNIYVIVNYDKIYRSTGGTQAFVRIDHPLSELNNDSLYTYYKPFNQVSGDSILFAATAFGSFYSLDQGNTWAANNKGIVAQNFYGLARANNGNMITTTSLGCFGSSDGADTMWTKVYPDTGYIGGQPLFKDNSGNLYTEGGTLYTDGNFQTRMVVKSVDNGASWQPDTLGISQMITATWFVDETGTQHAAEWVNYGGSATQLFAKAPGQSWTTDNAGFTTDSSMPTAFGTNGNGKIYYSGNILRSKQGAGNWMPDSAGLSGAGNIYDFAHNSSGNMYLGGYIGIWKQSGSSWVQMNNPASLTSYTYSAFAIAVDAGNTVWAAFSHFDIYYNSVGDGVYYTNDDGLTWNRPWFDVDTITFYKLVAMGDSVYGLSYYSGAYLFDKNGVTSVKTTLESNSGIKLFPNPSKGSCTLQLTGSPEICSASVLDVAGREVFPLFNNQKVSTFTFNTDKLSSGLYFVKVTCGNGRNEVCKLIKE